MALPPMGRVRPRTELHRRGTAARRPSPSNGRAGVESGWASWRTGGQLFTAAGSRTDTPALQDGGSVGEEAERREGGSRLRSAPRGVKLRGGKLKGPRWLYRRWSEYAPARSCIGGARRLAGPLHQMGGRAWNWVGAPEDRRPAFHGRRLRSGHPAFQDGGSDGEEAERREGGSSSAERLRGADLRGGKLRGPQWLYRQSSSGRRSGWAAGWAEPELLWRGTNARRPSPSNGRAGVELGGRAGGPEAGFSRP